MMMENDVRLQCYEDSAPRVLKCHIITIEEHFYGLKSTLLGLYLEYIRKQSYHSPADINTEVGTCVSYRDKLISLKVSLYT